MRRHVGQQQQQAGIVFILRHTPHLSPHQPLISTVQPGGDHLYQYCNYKETIVASAGVDTDTAGCGKGHFPSQKMFVDMLMMSTISNKYLIKNFENDD